jgi:hypothetical protein
MLDGVNDIAGQPRRCCAAARVARRPRAAVQVQPDSLQPVPESGSTRSPPSASPRSRRVLQAGGIVTTIRKTRGDDIAAACGQLAGEVQDRTRVERALARRRSASLARSRRSAAKPSPAGRAHDGPAAARRRCCAAPRSLLGACGRRRRPRRVRDRDADRITAPTSPTQKRARARTRARAAYFSRGQMTTALDQVKLAIQADPTSARPSTCAA